MPPTKRDQKMADEAMKRTVKELFLASDRNRQVIEKSGGIERGYPVVSTFPTGVSDGFIVFHTMSRKLHMYDGTTWISIGDVGAYVSLINSMVLLRGFWPFSSIGETNRVYDISGQGRILSNANVSFGLHNSFVPYGIFNGTTAYLARADEAGLEFTGALTFGCWVKLDTQNTCAIISKWGAAAQFSYELQYLTATGFRFVISNTGSDAFTVSSTHTTIDTGLWYHIVCRFDPSTELAIFVNGVKFANTTSIPATIFNSTNALNIGRRPTAAVYTDGSIAMPFFAAFVPNSAYVIALYEEGIPLFT